MTKSRLPLVATLISATFLISFLPAQSATIVGTKCTKANSTKTVLNIKYTCIKSGKKLVWNKGVALKPAPSASPSSTSTPIVPSSTSTPAAPKEDTSVNIAKGITYRYANGKLERMATYTGKYFDFDSRSASSFDPIRVKAYEAIRSKMNNSPHPNLQFEWDIKSAFPSELAEYSKNLVEVAASYWGWVFKEPLKVPAQLVTEQDLEWEKNQQLRFSDTVDILTLFATDGFRQQRAWMGGGAHFWYRSENDHTAVSLLNFQSPSYAKLTNMNANWTMVPTHEVTHIIQDYYRLGKPDSDMVSFDRRTHATFQEGTATLFGYALSMDNLGWYSDGMDEFLYGLRYDNYWKPVNNIDDVISILNATEARTNNSTHQASYPIGAMLYEYVIATYGIDSYTRILENLSKYSDFADNIKASLGISKNDLYQNAAPYLLAAFKRVLK